MYYIHYAVFLKRPENVHSFITSRRLKWNSHKNMFLFSVNQLTIYNKIVSHSQSHKFKRQLFILCDNQGDMPFHGNNHSTEFFVIAIVTSYL